MSRFISSRRLLYMSLILVTALTLVACAVPTTSPSNLTDQATSAASMSPTAAATEEGSEAAAHGTNSSEDSSFACSGVKTSANQEGPYYSVGSPENANLVEEGMAGSPVLVVGQVFDEGCNPIAGAKLDFWQADFDGEYDNEGYRLRGHLFTDEDGAYTLQTIEPGPYTGRPPHIHVKVFAPDGREILTSQVYTSGSEESADVRAAPDLLATYLETGTSGLKRVHFNFVVNLP